MRTPAIALTAALIALPAAGAAAPSDRHPGFYKFAPAPTDACREKQEQRLRAPVRPQRLAELPPAYAVRLKASPRERTTCFKLQPSK